MITCNNNTTSFQETNCNEVAKDMCGVNCGNNNCIIGTWINANNQSDIFEINSDYIIFYSPNSLDVCNIYEYSINEESNLCFNNDFVFLWHHGPLGGDEYNPLPLYFEVNENNILSFGMYDSNSGECLILEYNRDENGFVCL